MLEAPENPAFLRLNTVRDANMTRFAAPIYADAVSSGGELVGPSVRKRTRAGS
jgi:hypothetical protein